VAFEFRHESWFTPEVMDLLHESDAALVFAESSRYPAAPTEPRRRSYICVFTDPAKCSDRVTATRNCALAGRIRRWLAARMDVYAYFNNDIHDTRGQRADTEGAGVIQFAATAVAS